MEDRVIAHTLERATSTDFNAAQAMQTRRLSEFLADTYSHHTPPAAEDNSAGVTPSTILPDTVITGLQVYGIGGMTRVGIGSMTQVNASWLTTSDPVTAAETGYLRTPALIPYVSTAGLGLSSGAMDAYHLLCARLVEVVTLADTVDIFDVPSQAFVATSIVKRAELGIEFKWVLGAPLNSNSTIRPALDAGGTGWEPLAYVNFIYPAGTGTVNNSHVIDVARRSVGLAQTWQSPGDRGEDTRFSLPTTFQARLGTGISPDCGAVTEGVFNGTATSEINGERTIFASSPDHLGSVRIDAEDGSAPTNLQLVHYYLCPLEADTMRRWPLRTDSNPDVETYSGTTRGFVVGSTVQPNRRKANSAAITLYESPGTRGKWAHQSTIPAGAAQYLMSGYSWDLSRFSAIYPAVQTSGGQVLGSLGEQYYVSGVWHYRWKIPEVLAIPDVATTNLNRAWRLDLRPFVPRIASTVLLYVQLLGSSDFPVHHFEVRNRVDSGSNASPAGGDHILAYANSGERLAVGVIVPDAETHNTGFAFPCCMIEVPVGWTPIWNHADASASPIEGYHLDLVLRQVSRGSGTYSSPATVRIAGWKI